MYLVRLSAQAKHLLGDIRLQVRTLANTTPISSASSGQMKKTPSKIKTDLPLWYFMVPKSQRPPIVCEYVREKENQMEQLSLLTPKDLDGRGKKGLLVFPFFCLHFILIFYFINSLHQSLRLSNERERY